MKNTPFITAQKKVRDLAPGDVLMTERFGARFVTSAALDPVQQKYVIHFGLPKVLVGELAYVRTPENTVLVDKEWSDAEFTVILGMATGAQRGPNQ
jgi:hypothetical protein